MCGICECACVGFLGVCAAAAFIAGFYLFFGIIFIVLASKAKASVALYGGLLDYDISLFPYLCIGIGCLFTLLTVMGILGLKHGRKTKIVYIIAQLLVLILGLYIYIDAYPNEKQLEKHLFEGLNKTIHDYGLDVTHDAESPTESWDKLQENLECCGVKNYLDWEDIKPYGPQTPPTPISCCRAEHRMSECSVHVRFDHPAESNKIIYAQGCLPKVREEIIGTMEILHWFLIPILIMTCVGVFCSCCSSGVKKSTEMEERKMGPIVVKVKARRKSDVRSYDVEAAEKKNLEDDKPEAEEMQKLNPQGETQKEDDK